MVVDIDDVYFDESLSIYRDAVELRGRTFWGALFERSDACRNRQIDTSQL